MIKADSISYLDKEFQDIQLEILYLLETPKALFNMIRYEYMKNNNNFSVEMSYDIEKKKFTNDYVYGDSFLLIDVTGNSLESEASFISIITKIYNDMELVNEDFLNNGFYSINIIKNYNLPLFLMTDEQIILNPFMFNNYSYKNNKNPIKTAIKNKINNYDHNLDYELLEILIPCVSEVSVIEIKNFFYKLPPKSMKEHWKIMPHKYGIYDETYNYSLLDKLEYMTYKEFYFFKSEGLLKEVYINELVLKNSRMIIEKANYKYITLDLLSYLISKNSIEALLGLPSYDNSDDTDLDCFKTIYITNSDKNMLINYLECQKYFNNYFNLNYYVRLKEFLKKISVIEKIPDYEIILKKD